jgi:serine/threonine-protein kinase
MSSESSANTGRQYGRFGKYEVLAHVATGGMCAVYKAVDVDLGRTVALKVLPPDLANTPAVLERFRREARHAAKLRHENIVTIYEFAEACGTYFLALEFIDGIDLHKHIFDKHKLDPEESRDLVTQVARALDHLYQFSIVHRDVKPSNVLIAHPEDRKIAKLTDLGLARLTRDEEFRMTRTGSTVGTIDYMSPEQARDSGQADIRSDIYSLGCTWYHMLAGKPPFAEGGLGDRLYKHLTVEPTDIRQFNPAVPLALANVLRRMLAKRPGDRYQTPAELLKDLASLERTGGGNGQNRAPGRPRDKTGSPLAPPQTSGSWPGRQTVQDLPSASPEQQQTAAGQFERAKQVLAVGNFDYAIHLLLSCCQLEPANLTYRRLLRRSVKAQLKNHPPTGRSALRPDAATRAKFRAARAAHDSRKVLEAGEELLLRNPWDVPTLVEMAEAAENLGLLDLAIWLLEQVWKKDAPDLALSKALARLHEKRGNFARAIGLWEVVQKLDPADFDALRKARDLAATETITRGQLKAELERRSGGEID